MNYQIAYPRSGSTACRYLIEMLTGMPTNGVCGTPNPKDKLQQPLIHSGDDFIFHKRHDFKGVRNTDFVLFIVRDPFEACIRHNEKPRGLSLDKMKGYLDGWFSLLQDYDEFIGNKCHIYYEQLIKVADRASLDLYPNPESTGAHYHAAKLSVETLSELYQYCMETYPHLITNYLTQYYFT